MARSKNDEHKKWEMKLARIEEQLALPHFNQDGMNPGAVEPLTQQAIEILQKQEADERQRLWAEEKKAKEEAEREQERQARVDARMAEMNWR